MKKLCFFLLLAGAVFLQQPSACTSVIISAKAAPDGRPLLWKHRDTGAPSNHIAYVNEGGYRFLGLVNSDEPDGAVWTGTNETGFSIMNTASYNLKDDEVKEMDQEGMLMRRALQICRTVEDFEHFLDTLSRPMRVEANFGVIDAAGGAAYFETNNWRYYKKDVNDPAVAPDGYLVYTNFSFEGRKDEGMGYVRYENASLLFERMQPEGFTPERIFSRLSRSFANPLLGIDLMQPADSPNARTGWFVEQDFIPRLESTASIVIQGVVPGTDPEATTMWTALGYPPTSVALPLWVKMGDEQPEWVTYDASLKTAPLCYEASRLKGQVYPIRRGNGRKYLHWQLLWNEAGTGYIQQLQPVETEVFRLFDACFPASGKGALEPEKIRAFYRQVDSRLRAAYEPLGREDAAPQPEG